MKKNRLQLEEMDKLWIKPPQETQLDPPSTYHIPRTFRNIFYQYWNRPQYEQIPAWLKELPGGGTTNLHFLELLTTKGSYAFLKHGYWTSRYVTSSYNWRRNLYNEEPWATKEARKLLREVPARLSTCSFIARLRSWHCSLVEASVLLLVV